MEAQFLEREQQNNVRKEILFKFSANKRVHFASLFSYDNIQRYS